MNEIKSAKIHTGDQNAPVEHSGNRPIKAGLSSLAPTARSRQGDVSSAGAANAIMTVSGSVFEEQVSTTTVPPVPLKRKPIASSLAAYSTPRNLQAK